MIKRLSIYTTVALALCACSDEDFTLPNGIGEDGSLEITLAVPEMQTVSTRANEDDVNDVTMLVFSGSTLKQIEKYDGSDLKPAGNNQYSLSVSIDKEIRSATDLKFYFIANSPASAVYAEDMTEADVKAITYTAVVDADDNMTMSGTATLTDMTSGNSVSVMRNAAKVTVNSGRVTDDGEIQIDNGIAYNFSVFSTAADASVVAAACDLKGDATSATPLPTTVGTEAEVYVHPTANEGLDATNRPFVVLRASYMNTNYYYRVDFRNKDEQGNLQDLNLESNHWYKFVVTGISGAGSATVAEAAANPSPLVEVTIYDVAPRSYNIITDGTRELGVSHELKYEGEAGGTRDLFVKLYSPSDSEYPEDTVDAWRSAGLVSTTYKWLTLKDVEDVTDNAQYAGEASGVEAGTKGRLYRLEIEFGETVNPGTLEAMISVDWRGLNREVPVKWEREFTGSDLCDVKLTVNGYNASGNTYKYLDKEDYWTFLTDKVNGVTEDQNGGNIRNEGLHFPVMYGESGKLWTYEYEITYNDFFSGSAYDWRITTSGGIDGLKVSETSGTNKTGPLTVTVTKTSNDWTYSTGELLLELKAAGADDSAYTKHPLTVYHTGFFHDHTAKINDIANSTSSYRVGGEPDSNRPWYYYEVLTDGAGNHWLDRNLGATASGLYIEATGGTAYHGNSEAAGGYYRAAEYKKGEAPKMYVGLCPPGFEIPREEIWNSVRNSTAFSTAQMGSYYNAALRCTNGMYIYFPKALYYAEGNKTGESRAGYYWSSTKASGLEKDQIGNWLRCLQISGNVTTYINGQVQGRENAQGFAMSVRCVNKTASSGETFRTEFNVIGATHVYLYSVNADGSRNAVTTWPGKSIGTYSTMKDGQMVNFSYESPTTSAEQFYVIFSYKDANGKIHTVSRATDGHTLYSANQNPANLDGWKVVGEKSNTGSVTTATGGTWKVANPTDDSKANVYFNGIALYSLGDNTNVFYCWNVEGWDNVVMYYTSNSSNVEVTGERLHDYYPQLYRFEVTGVEDITRICFTNGKDDPFLNNTINNWVANSYYDNSGTGRNKILPGEVSELKSGMWRIATRPIWPGKNHYLYQWGGTDASKEGDATSKPMNSLMEGKYFYYDIYSDALGFLINCGAFNNGNQTNDLTGNGYKEGKLIQQWQTVEIKK